MNRLLSHPAKLIFLGVLALVVAANHAFLFTNAWHEDGDFAVNALQIERAQHLNEIYGNYSRFHFNHPGPAFFYAYAVGEYVLYDWLEVVPSPHNAHVLAGVILQVFFFTAALLVAREWIRRRWFLPLALLLAGVHFSFAGNVFTSIWPPHVLLMPFLCFLVAGASTAAGRAQHLPLTVLAGCFLVHAHIAQALFVGALFLAIYFLFWRRERAPTEPALAPFQRHRGPHLLAGACIALFALPLVIDLFSGLESNLANIVRFIISGDEPPKTFTQTVAYLLSFFAYFHNQDHFLPARAPGDPGVIWTRAEWYWGWLAIVAVIGFALYRLKSRDRSDPERRFLYALGTLVVLCLPLTILWGRMNTGPMFEFNSHFYYAYLYAILLLFAAAVASLIPEVGVRPLGTLLCLGGAVAFWQGVRLPDSTNEASPAWVTATKAVLSVDPLPTATKFLVFRHDDWGNVAKTALALKRMGGSYRVDGNWSFMFGRYRTYQPAPPDFGLQGMSVWRFSHRELPGRFAVLPKELKVYFDPSPLDPAHFVIDCSRDGNLEDFSVYGFNTPDGPYAWTNLRYAALQFQSPRVERDVVLTMDAEPFAPRGHIKHQPMTLLVNGRQVASFDITSRQIVTARIPAETWNLAPAVTIVFSLPGSDSPRRLGISGDPRILGWALYQMTFDAAAP